MHTVEIDDVIAEAKKYEQVVVGKILEIKAHPNADRLRLAKVDVGPQSESPLNIVCGAPNIEVGQIVPVAMLGAILPNGLEIKKAKVRGEVSEGMMCAEDELGLGEMHEGIMILEANAKIGTNFADYLKLKDVVFEVDNKSITNRPDLWGHIGYAREFNAFLDAKKTKKFEEVVMASINDIVPDKEEKIEIKIEDFKKCPRYMAVKMSGIKMADSPDWLKERLITVGIRPINNVVDVTNYVMMEIGQPMHAFDASLISLNDAKEHQIIVRNAKKGEKMETLDGQERELNEEDLLIANSEGPIGLAGVMGAKNSEISSETTEIVLEAANFDAVSIRKTANRLNLRTDAAQRFEKSLDPNFCELAMVRAVNLIKELCPGAQVSSIVSDEKQFELFQGPIEFNISWLEKLVGTKIDNDKIDRILIALGFTVEKQNDTYKVRIPSWRATKDISLKYDIAEEIARIYGYNNIAPQKPSISLSNMEGGRERAIIFNIKDTLSGSGALNEVYNYAFVGENNLKKLGIDSSKHIRLLNPLSNEQGLLRQSLATNMFLNVHTNQRRQDDFGIFEIGSVFLSISGVDFLDDKKEDTLPWQEKNLAILLSSSTKKHEELIAVMKTQIQNLFANFYRDVEYNETENIPNWAEEKLGAEIIVGDKSVGAINKLEFGTAKRYGIKNEVVFAELPISKIMAVAKERTRYQEINKFPPVVRDLAFVVSSNVSYRDIYREILSFHQYVSALELFDVYTGSKLGPNKKNLAFHISYQADKTLTSEEVDEIQAKLFSLLEDKYEAKIRDY